MYIINTRPATRAKVLTQQLNQAGYAVLDLPLLALQPLALSIELEQQYTDFNHADIVVVVSPTAAELGLKYYQKLGYPQQALQEKIWIAVGKATQQYLAKHKIQSLVPEVETSEGMLQLELLQYYKNTTVAFWRGIGGRTFMMEQLQQQGCTIINMLLYQRNLPEDIQQQASIIPSSAIVLISSEESWNNWCHLGKMYHWILGQYHYIVLGDRVTQLIQQYFMDIQQHNVPISTVHRLDIDHLLLPLRKSPLQ